MYVCPNCGKEFEKETFFCGDCGTKTVLNEPVAEVPNAPVVEKKEPFIVTLFSFISNTVQVITGFFALMSITLHDVNVYIDSDYYSTYLDEYVHMNDTFAIFSLIFAILGLGISAVSFIFSLIKKADTKTKFARITGLTAGLLLLILAIALVVHM